MPTVLPPQGLSVVFPKGPAIVSPRQLDLLGHTWRLMGLSIEGCRKVPESLQRALKGWYQVGLWLAIKVG